MKSEKRKLQPMFTAPDSQTEPSENLSEHGFHSHWEHMPGILALEQTGDCSLPLIHMVFFNLQPLEGRGP